MCNIAIMSEKMIQQITLKAYAKLNFGLQVLSIRQDGFHGIESFFQRISLSDEITIRLQGDDNTCCVYSPLMILPKENTITRAVDGLRSVSGFSGGIDIRIEKYIPAGAGLGGGSSDAACVLMALNNLCKTNLSYETLFMLSSAIGSDVPFFLSEQDAPSSAVVTGRGECIHFVESRKDLFFVIICPNVHSSTKEAYFLVDKNAHFGIYCDNRQGIVEELEHIYKMPVREWKFFNSFTAPLLHIYPIIGEALFDLQQAGALFSAMTGSGSAVFGVFESREIARLVQKQLCHRWNRCFVSSVS